VSTSDLAIFEGMENWQPLELVLAHLPPLRDELGAILPDVPPSDSPVAASEEPTTEEPFIMQNNTSETVESSSAPPPAEPAPPLTATQKTKRKLNKIVIQPILPLEPVAPTTAKKKSQTAKAPLTLEPLRPTTALPPVSGFAPREKKPGKGPIKTGQVALRDLPEKATVTKPTPAAATNPPPLPVTTPTPSPKPLLPPISILPEKKAEKGSAKYSFPRIPREVIYAGAVMAFLIVCVMISFVYLIISHYKTPAAANPENAPPTEHVETQGPPATPVTAADYSDRGFSRQSNGDLDGAIADYNKALELDSKDVRTFYRRGLALQAKGDLNGALADYNTVLGLDAKNADAFSNRGFIKQAQGDLDGAMSDYTQALLLNPKIPAAYYNQGLIDAQKGYFDAAISDFNHALDLDPKMAFAYYNRGVAKNTEGDLDGAISDFSQALVLNPRIARAFSDRGIARQAKGDLDGALADYSQAFTLDPNLTAIFTKRAQIKMQKGDLEGVIADTTLAIDADPKNGLAYYNRGLARVGKGDLDGAKTDLTAYCALAPRDTSADTARIYLWLISTEENPQGNADQELSTSLLNAWNSPPEDLTSKIAAFLLGHIKEKELIADAASPDPSREPAQYCKVWYFAAMKRLLAGDMTTAINYFQKCIGTNQTTLCESTFAQAELKALGQNREVAAKPEAAQ